MLACGVEVFATRDEEVVIYWVQLKEMDFDV